MPVPVGSDRLNDMAFRRLVVRRPGRCRTFRRVAGNRGCEVNQPAVWEVVWARPVGAPMEDWPNPFPRTHCRSLELLEKYALEDPDWAATVQRVDVNLMSLTGPCNGCKERVDYLADQLKELFPNTRELRGDRWRVYVTPNYTLVNGRSVRPGRFLDGQGRDPHKPDYDPSTARATTSYGYPPEMVELRESAAAVAHGYTGDDALYLQAKITPGDQPSYVYPEHLGQIPDMAGPARSDRYSPTGSLRTPSPPGSPWEFDPERNTYTSEKNGQWWAVDPSIDGRHDVMPLAEFDRRYPYGYQSPTAPPAHGQGYSAYNRSPSPGRSR